MAKKAEARRAKKPLKPRDLTARKGSAVKGGGVGPCFGKIKEK